MEIGVWYLETDFTVYFTLDGKRESKRERGPAVVIVSNFDVLLEVPLDTKTINSFIVYRKS
jgi:hypothetical protein